MRFILFFLMISCTLKAYSQVPTQANIQQMTQQAITQLSRQIADLENQITQAKKNGVDPSLIKQMDDKLTAWKQELAVLKNAAGSTFSLPKQKNNSNPCPPFKWTGFVRLVDKYAGELGIRERSIDVSFTAAVPTLNHNSQTTNLEFTDDKGIGYIKDHFEAIIEGKHIGTCTCTGQGQAELHEVVIDESDSTYSISAVGPPCNQGGDGSDGSCAGPSSDIGISAQRLPANKNLLTGSYTWVAETGTGPVTTTISWNLRRACPPWNDSYTEKRIKTLKTKVIDHVTRFIKRVNDELCIQLRVAQSFRTIKEQDELYAQGRTKPGKIVTNAKGGESKHNFGSAIDVYLVNCDGTIDLNNKVPPEVVKIAKEEGFEWGGDWTKRNKQGKVFKDYPHFEMN